MELESIRLPPSLFTEEEWRKTVIEIKSNEYYKYTILKKEERAHSVKKGRVKVNLIDTHTWIKDVNVWYNKRKGWMFESNMYPPTPINCKIESLYDGTTKAFVYYMRMYTRDLLYDPKRLPRFINMEGIRFEYILKPISDEYFGEEDFETINI